MVASSFYPLPVRSVYFKIPRTSRFLALWFYHENITWILIILAFMRQWRLCTAGRGGWSGWKGADAGWNMVVLVLVGKQGSQSWEHTSEKPICSLCQVLMGRGPSASILRIHEHNDHFWIHEDKQPKLHLSFHRTCMVFSPNLLHFVLHLDLVTPEQLLIYRQKHFMYKNT